MPISPEKHPNFFLSFLLLLFVVGFGLIDLALYAFGMTPFLSPIIVSALVLVFFFWLYGKWEKRSLRPGWEEDAGKKVTTSSVNSAVENLKTDTEFSALDFSSFTQVLIDLELSRFVARKASRVRSVLALPLSVFFLGGGVLVDITFATEDFQGAFSVTGFVIVLMIWLVWVRTPLFDYKLLLKKTFMGMICSLYGDLSYSTSPKLPRKFLKELSILPKHHSSWSQDVIEGSYEQVDLWISRLILRKRPHEDLSEQKARRVYRGMVIRIQFPRKFLGKTIVKRDRGILNILEREKDLDRVELEDALFEDQFEVYGTDQQEARFLLTTRFMEVLKELGALYGKRRKENKSGVKPGDLSCEFFGQSFVLSIPTKEKFFHPGSTRQSVLEHRDLKLFMRQMSRLFELVELLKESMSRR